MSEEVMQQPTPLQGRKLLGLIPLPAKKPKQPKQAKPQKTPPVAATPGDPTFYEQAIEWTHRADKVVNLVLGYLLAIASVLGFMDVLSNGEVLSHVPNLFYVWLAIMGLGVDFQILLVIGRVPDLARMMNGWYKFFFLTFNFAFLGFLAYMSIVIGAVFTQHRDVPGTIVAAMQALGIDATSFVFERATLATLLLVLMAVDRTMERWRMQVQRASQNSPENATQAAPAPLQGNGQPQQGPVQTDIEKLILAMQEAQNKQLQVVVEQFTRVTVEALQQVLPEASAPLQIAAPNTVDNASKAPLDNFQQGYRQRFEDLLKDKPDVTVEEAVKIVQCSEPTAKKWLEKLAQRA